MCYNVVDLYNILQNEQLQTQLKISCCIITLFETSRIGKLITEIADW